MPPASTETQLPPWTAEPARLAPGSGMPAIALALAWLEALGEQQGWPPKTLFALTLCADEALTNIVHHARRPDGRQAELWLACGHVPGGLALCIEDDGAAFDPTAQPPPQLAESLHEAVPGGHGLRLMRHYLRRLRYWRANGRNALLLELDLPGPAAATP